MSSETFQQPSDHMNKGPSPIVPLLLVMGLCLFLHGNFSSIVSLNLPLASEGEKSIFMCFLFVPVIVILAEDSSHTIVLPLALILVTYAVSAVLLGPLMLILMAYIAGAYMSSVECHGEELGWGCLLVLVFFLLHWLATEEGRQSGALVLAVIMFLCYHCFP